MGYRWVGGATSAQMLDEKERKAKVYLTTFVNVQKVTCVPLLGVSKGDFHKSREPDELILATTMVSSHCTGIRLLVTGLQPRSLPCTGHGSEWLNISMVHR